MVSNTNDLARADGGDTAESMEEVIQDSPLVVLFGDHPKARMLSVIAGFHPRPINPSDIVEKAAVSRQSWYRHKDDLIATGIIEEVGNAGNSPLYSLAEDDDRVEWLEKLRDFTVEPLKESREDDE